MRSDNFDRTFRPKWDDTAALRIRQMVMRTRNSGLAIRLLKA